jgi:nitrate/nitrite transporter NarK
LLADLRIDRVTYAQVNLWATLIGALGALGVGRLADVFGARAVLTVMSMALSVIVCFMSQVAGLWSLAVAMALTPWRDSPGISWAAGSRRTSA